MVAGEGGFSLLTAHWFCGVDDEQSRKVFGSDALWQP